MLSNSLFLHWFSWRCHKHFSTHKIWVVYYYYKNHEIYIFYFSYLCVIFMDSNTLQLLLLIWINQKKMQINHICSRVFSYCCNMNTTRGFPSHLGSNRRMNLQKEICRKLALSMLTFCSVRLFRLTSDKQFKILQSY